MAWRAVVWRKRGQGRRCMGRSRWKEDSVGDTEFRTWAGEVANAIGAAFRGDVIIPVHSQRNPAEELLADSYEAVSELNANAIGIATEKLTLEYDWFIRTDVGAVLLDQVAGNRFRKRSGFLRYAAHDGAVSSFGRNDGSVGEGS
jgi:hypothetical protein